MSILYISVDVLRYKERLKTKYVNPKKLKQCSGTLVGSSWTFVKKGLDDFRDGMPPYVPGDEMVVRVSTTPVSQVIMFILDLWLIWLIYSIIITVFRDALAHPTPTSACHR